MFVSFSVNRELKILSWIINTIPLLGEELKKNDKEKTSISAYAYNTAIKRAIRQGKYNVILPHCILLFPVRFYIWFWFCWTQFPKEICLQ